MTLFASYASTFDAERAAAALIDRGARKEDLSVVAHQHDGAVEVGHGESNAEAVAKHGLTTTTPADAAMGAAKGLSIGAGLGVLGAIAASILVPGIGLVVGAGALATAIAGSAAAGTVAGGIVGYLKDQGMGEEVAARYHATVEAGGAILALQVPSGDLSQVEAESIIMKYGASGVFTSYPSTTADVAPLPVAAPHVVPSEPLETLTPVTPPVTAVAGVPAVPVAPVTVDPVTGRPIATPVVATPAVTTVATPTAPAVIDPGSVVVTHSDPATGYAIAGYVDDIATGLRRPVRYDRGLPYYDVGLPATPIPVGTPTVAVPVVPVAVPVVEEVPVAAVTPTRSDPATGLALEGYVEDPVTGVRRAVRFEHGRAYYIV